MSFDVTADAYGRFMGRFSEPLAERLVAHVDARPGQRALDVGCGPGALTAQLVGRLGADAVAAVDPSASFVTAARDRFSGLEVHTAAAEDLPFDDDTFDLTLAQLVVPFMSDPVQGLREMGRITRPDGTVAASVWDLAGGNGPYTAFWAAVHDTDPDAPDEAAMAGAREGHLSELCAAAGLHVIELAVLSVTVGFASFHEWWDPFTLGVGPAGAYVATLSAAQRETLRASCRHRLPPPRFEVTAKAWCVMARPGAPQR